MYENIESVLYRNREVYEVYEVYEVCEVRMNKNTYE